MKRKRKPRKRKSQRHILAYRKGIVSTPLRQALEQCLRVRLNGSRHWSVESIGEATARLSNGRAKRFLIRYWCNGSRRAPAWFVAVLDGELAQQIEHRRAIREQLARYETGDRRKGPEASARGRYHRMRQLGRPINEGAAVGAPGIDASPDPTPDTPGPE
jgi:hypothetical protein